MAERTKYKTRRKALREQRETCTEEGKDEYEKGTRHGGKKRETGKEGRKEGEGPTLEGRKMESQKLHSHVSQTFGQSFQNFRKVGPPSSCGAIIPGLLHRIPSELRS